MNAGTDTSQAVRDLVDDALREFGRGGKLNQWVEGQYQTGGLTQKVHQLAQRRGVNTSPPDGSFWPAVVEYVWTLARIGALALMPQEPPFGPVHDESKKVPGFVITELGQRLLTEAEFSPQDWDRYRAKLLLSVPTPDDVVLVHLREADLAWEHTLYRSSAVMLGCAVERLIILVAEAIVAAKLPAPGDKLGGKLANPKVGISEIFDDVRTVLEHADHDKKLPREIADVLDRRITALFDHARALRNRSGHPTVGEVTRDEALSGLLLFPAFYSFVDKLIAALNMLAAPAPTAPPLAGTPAPGS
jgi:hypothetical protein